MDAEREARLERLFERVAALPRERRAAFLDEACGSDADLRETLEALAERADRAHAFMEGVAGPAVARLTTALIGAHDSADADADPLVGQHVAHFHVVERLGGGGMGRVYRALDLRLDRTVALKFLPPHLVADEAAKHRLMHEARAASALDHPGICAIHEVGEMEGGELFIAMAYYEGESLKHKIARGPLPIDEAVDYVAQIADALQRAHDAGIVHRDVKPANVMVTQRGIVKIVDFGLATISADVMREGTSGTVAYMSPEQTRGAAVDARTDLWSLGVVSYEMLTGRRPFRGDSDEAVVRAIRDDAPTPVDELRAGLPTGLAPLVRRCLEKDPAHRYHRADDLLADIRRVQQGGTAPRSARRRRVLWYGAAALVGALVGDTPAVSSDATPAEAAHAAEVRRTVNPEAFALYLQGVRSADPVRGIAYLEQAIAKDPRFALARVALAGHHIMITHDRARAEHEIAVALALDPSLSEAYDVLGVLRMWIDHDWTAAEDALRHAIALNPRNSRAHHELGQLLMRVGRCDEAPAEEQRAVLDDPAVAHYQSGLAEVYLYCRRYDEAVREFEKAIAIGRDPANAYENIGDAYFYQRRYAEALAAYEKSRKVPGWARVPLGDRDDALRQARELTAELARDPRKTRISWTLARIYTTLGERDQAMASLERVYADGSGMVVYLGVMPHFDPLRGEPRFRALLAKVRLAR